MDDPTRRVLHRAEHGESVQKTMEASSVLDVWSFYEQTMFQYTCVKCVYDVHAHVDGKYGSNVRFPYWSKFGLARHWKGVEHINQTSVNYPHSIHVQYKYLR